MSNIFKRTLIILIFINLAIFPLFSNWTNNEEDKVDSSKVEGINVMVNSYKENPIATSINSRNGNRGSWSDSFDNENNILTKNNLDITGGNAELSTD